MRYFDFIKEIKEISTSHILVNEYGEGDIYEYLNNGEHKYPCIFLTVTNLTTTDSGTAINFTLFYTDRLVENQANKTSIQSTGISVIKQILSKYEQLHPEYLLSNVNYTPFTEKFTDMCAGVFCDVVIENQIDTLEDYDNECEEGAFAVKTITLTKNGIYDIVGYDSAVVLVETEDVKLESITITENGVYKPEIGGYNEVIVDIEIPECPEIPLTAITINSNGTYIPEEGGYNEVIVDIEIPECPDCPETPLESITITENGVYVPEEGGYNEVIVDVYCDEVQLGQLVVSENGNYYPIDYEVNGFDLVTVEVPETPLTDITITENGVYTPSDGGYSKVTVNVSNGGELTSKIKVNSLRITDDCIVDGTWPAENIDTTHMTSFANLFSGCTSLNNINLNGWDVRNVENANSMFAGCSSLQNIDLSGLKTDVYPYTFTSDDMFRGCTSLKEFSLSNNNINGKFWATSMRYMFYNCSSLTTVDLSGVNLNYISYITKMFYGCTSLKEVDLRRWNGSNLYYISVENFSAGSGIINYVGGKTIDEVISNNITILNGLTSASIGIMSNYADRASLRALINGLADLTGSTSQTLTLGSTLTAKLTNEDIAIATAKNWTIA